MAGPGIRLLFPKFDDVRRTMFDYSAAGFTTIRAENDQFGLSEDPTVS